MNTSASLKTLVKTLVSDYYFTGAGRNNNRHLLSFVSKVEEACRGGNEMYFSNVDTSLQIRSTRKWKTLRTPTSTAMLTLSEWVLEPEQGEERSSISLYLNAVYIFYVKTASESMTKVGREEWRSINPLYRLVDLLYEELGDPDALSLAAQLTKWYGMI